MAGQTQSGFPEAMGAQARTSGAEGWEAMAEDVVDSVKTYVKDEPVKAMFWALGIGFVLGWRIKPW